VIYNKEFLGLLFISFLAPYLMLFNCQNILPNFRIELSLNTNPNYNPKQIL
jgi:hypothetical protein